jgi:hypothetical protein
LSRNIKLKIYKTIILPVVLYGCKTWSLKLREEKGVRAFEKRVLRRIFGPKRDEMTEEWRKMHSEELHNLHSSPDDVTDRGVLSKARDKLLYRLYIIRVTSGAHVEHLLK